MGSKRAASAYSNTVWGQTPENRAIFTFSMYNYCHYEHYVLDSEICLIQKSGNGDRTNNSEMKPTAELKAQRGEALCSVFLTFSWYSCLSAHSFLLKTSRHLPDPTEGRKGTPGYRSVFCIIPTVPLIFSGGIVRSHKYPWKAEE